MLRVLIRNHLDKPAKALLMSTPNMFFVQICWYSLDNDGLVFYLQPCWTRIYPDFANSVDPDQLASEEANWSGSALFGITYMNLY